MPPSQPSVRGLSIVYALLFFAVGTFLPYLSVFYRSVGLSFEGIGVVTALTGFVAVVAAPVWGAAVDRLRDARGPLLVAGLWGAVAAGWLAVNNDPPLVPRAPPLLAAASPARWSLLA